MTEQIEKWLSHMGQGTREVDRLSQVRVGSIGALPVNSIGSVGRRSDWLGASTQSGARGHGPAQEHAGAGWRPWLGRLGCWLVSVMDSLDIYIYR
jgi:hypothetical protein